MMIYNRLKFTSLLLVSSWLKGRVLDWHLSQPGFDPSYENLVSLARLMSSDRTKQICLWMTIYIYIYLILSAMIYNSSRLFLMPLLSFLRVLNYKRITVNFSFNSFFTNLDISWYLCHCKSSFIFT